MIIKKDFALLKGIPNVTRLSAGSMKNISVPGDRLNLVRAIQLIEKRVNHFTSKRVFSLTSNIREVRKTIHVVNFDYPLHITYNIPTSRIVINLNAFQVDEISRLDPINVYACLVYGICFADLVNQKIKVKDMYYGPITNFLTSAFVKVFGKEYGLLGPYATEINKLKFLISCYILGAFFNVTGLSAYKKSSSLSSIDFKQISDKLNTYDFSNIDAFIKALSELKVLPGIDKHKFAGKLLRYYQLNFFPAIEDLSRFLSFIVTSSVRGSNIVPTYMDATNTSEFTKILSVGKTIFR